MPIYNYACNAGCPFVETAREVIQKHDDPAPLCPSCEAPMARQPATSSFAFVTKGGNLFNFSGAHHGPRHRSKKVKVIGKNHGMGSDKRRAPWKAAPIERLPPKLVKP